MPACTAPPTSVSVAAAADVNPTGIQLAVALSASAFAIVLGLAVAPVIHRFLLSRSSSQVRQRRMAQSLDKAAIAAQQRRVAEHGKRNAFIDQWLATQDLPRALPALRPHPTSSFAAPAADTFRRETEIKQSIEKEQKRSTEMAMKIGSLPHSQWHVQRGGSFSSRDVSAPQSPQSTLNSGAAPSLPPYPSHLPPLHTK